MAFADTVHTLCTRIAAASTVAVLLVAPQAHAQNNVVVNGNNTLNVRTGDNYFTINALDTSTVNILGGTVSSLIAENSSTVNVSGGTTQSIFAVDTTMMTVTGGSVVVLSYENACRGSVTGAAVTSFFASDGDTSVMGGTFTNALRELGAGTSTIAGFSFALTGTTAATYTNSTYRYNGTLFTVTGRLRDNATVATYQFFDSAMRTNLSTGAVLSNPGKFVLNDLTTGRTTILDASAPEPSSQVLLSVGLVSGIGMVRRRRLNELRAT